MIHPWQVVRSGLAGLPFSVDEVPMEDAAPQSTASNDVRNVLSDCFGCIGGGTRAEDLHAHREAVVRIHLLEPVDAKINASVDGALREVVLEGPLPGVTDLQVVRQGVWSWAVRNLKLQAALEWSIANLLCIKLLLPAAARALGNLLAVGEHHQPQVLQAPGGERRGDQRPAHAASQLRRKVSNPPFCVLRVNAIDYAGCHVHALQKALIKDGRWRCLRSRAGCCGDGELGERPGCQRMIHAVRR
mmetsp:Transcript_3449/g.9378  ORF Transcript_3449/g.9378 Transcript_3449/m.9378 type:complete len:245 (+) Transcript_3449:361-1095(+)